MPAAPLAVRRDPQRTFLISTLNNERIEETVSADKKAQSRAQRDEKRRQEAQKDRRSMAIYSTIAAVVVISAAALMFWGSGILQRNITALDINGTKYTAVEVQYYYDTLYSNQASMYVFDPGTSVKKQVYNQETGQSWYDHLMELAVEDLTTDTALAAKANSEGYTLSQEAQENLDATLKQLDNVWVSYGAASRDDFIRTQFGPYMTYEKLTALIQLDILSSDYASTQLDAIHHPDSDYETYYRDNANTMDTFLYTQLAFQAAVSTTDSEGNPVEMSDADKSAAMEEQKTAKKALAEEAKAKLEAGADPEDIAQEYQDELYSTSLSRRASGSNISYSIYADWLLDPARKSGDITIIEQETVDSYYYYVFVFHDRLRDEENTHTVRHLLVRAGLGTGTPSQEQYDQAEESAKSLLEEWKSGEATQDSFAQLAADHSSDTSSAANGGLISGINSNSNYVEPFKNWATDSTRKEGDVELVKSDYGWHIMYYVSTDDPTWKITAGNALRSQDYEQLAADATQGWNASRGMGMNFIRA